MIKPNHFSNNDSTNPSLLNWKIDRYRIKHIDRRLDSIPSFHPPNLDWRRLFSSLIINLPSFLFYIPPVPYSFLFSFRHSDGSYYRTTKLILDELNDPTEAFLLPEWTIISNQLQIQLNNPHIDFYFFFLPPPHSSPNNKHKQNKEPNTHSPKYSNKPSQQLYLFLFHSVFL